MTLRSYTPGSGVCDTATGSCAYQYADENCDVGCALVSSTTYDAGSPLESDPPTLGHDGGVTDNPEATPGPIAQCLPDLCIGVGCDDENPCTDDLCNSLTGECSHDALNNEEPCLTGPDQCGEARCIQGTCVPFFICEFGCDYKEYYLKSYRQPAERAFSGEENQSLRPQRYPPICDSCSPT